MASAQAAEAPDRLCGSSLSDEAIRRACHAEAPAIAAWHEAAEAACEASRRADVLPEFRADATKVNTATGWRDGKIGIFAVRPPGEPATAAEWDDRPLPPPSARVAFAAVEASEVFGARWSPWAARLGIDAPAEVSAPADGAG